MVPADAVLGLNQTWICMCQQLPQRVARSFWSVAVAKPSGVARSCEAFSAYSSRLTAPNAALAYLYSSIFCWSSLACFSIAFAASARLRSSAAWIPSW